MGVRTSIPAVLALILFGIEATAQDPWPTKKWLTAMPKDVGLDSTVLAEFDADLANEKLFGYVDTFTIVRNGKIAFDKTYSRDYGNIYGKLAKEGPSYSVRDPSGPDNIYSSWWHPYYRRGELHTLQTVTNAVVSVVIGVAIARNEFPDLDTPVIKFFDEKKVANLDDRKRRMTIRHLLLMMSGSKWSAEAGADTEDSFEASSDWVKFTIDLPMANEPGKTFNYAHGNVQLLVHIFNMAVGMDIEEYATRHLFAPLGIEQFFWKRTPTGHVNGSRGLYLRPHDLAKIGYLYLHKGVWDGKRIVTAEWVKDSSTGHVEVPWFKGGKWGYLWGTLPYGEKDRFTMFGKSGFGGQGLAVFPEHDTVIVYTGWNVLDDQSKLTPPVVVERFHRALIDKRAGDNSSDECVPMNSSPICEVIWPKRVRAVIADRPPHTTGCGSASGGSTKTGM